MSSDLTCFYELMTLPTPTTPTPREEKITFPKIKIVKEPHATWDFGFVLMTLFGVGEIGFEEEC